MTKAAVWRFGRGVLAVALGLGGSLAAQTAPDIAGTWQATVPGSGLRVVLKVEHAEDAGAGGLQGTIFPLNPDFGSEGREATSMRLEGPVFKFAVTPIDVSYEGRMSTTGAAIVGNWTQGKVTHDLTFSRATPETAWAMPAASKAMPKDADPEFEVATIKLSDPANRSDGFQLRGRHFIGMNQTVEKLIAFSYGLHVKQIIDGPGWFSTDHFDIDGVPDVEGQPSIPQMQGLMRKLLADRFQLKFHKEKRELSVYAITVAKTGPKIEKSIGDPNGLPDQSGGQNGGVRTDRYTNCTMNLFALILQFIGDRPVIDETGLAGRYDFSLKYSLSDVPSEDPNAPPGLFTAIQEQLGLKLEAKRAPAEAYVVDHVTRPSSN